MHDPLTSDTPQSSDEQTSSPLIRVIDYNLTFGGKQVLFDINLAIPQGKVTAFIGPSGCGKTSLLRSLNRLNDLQEEVHYSGDILFHGRSLYGPDLDPISLRRKVGMIFQKSNPFAMSIYENVAFGLRIRGIRKKAVVDSRVEKSLIQAGLWEEVKNRLQSSAVNLSGGQQQRLCIARVLVNEPEVLLMDEPCSALDPQATARIENLILDLRGALTIIIVTHNLQQANRISDHTGFFFTGNLVEFGDTPKIFTQPSQQKTEDYVTGRVG